MGYLEDAFTAVFETYVGAFLGIIVAILVIIAIIYYTYQAIRTGKDAKTIVETGANLKRLYDDYRSNQRLRKRVGDDLQRAR